MNSIYGRFGLPDDTRVVVETLLGSNLPNVLPAMDHDLKPEQDAERILPTDLIERFERRADVTLGVLTPAQRKR